MKNSTCLQNKGPLSGIKIIDLSMVLSGPAATVILADQGADVIKIEPSTGDIVRHLVGSTSSLTPPFISLNRGKRGIVIDLKKSKGIDLVKKMITSADVLVQNFRPGVMDRIGLGYEVIKKINPKLVYCSISGFGPKGTYAHQRVYDPIIQALSGLADIQRDAKGYPQMIRTTIPDKTAGLTAAQAITAALFSRSVSGKGQHVEVAMLDAMVSFIWAEGMAGFTKVGDEDNTPPNLASNWIFKTTDGFITASTITNTEWQNLCKLLKREAWINDERFNTPANRVRNREIQISLLSDVFCTQSSTHWLKILGDEIPCAPVLTRKEVLSHEQIVENELIEEFDQPGLGRVRQARPAARFSDTPAAIQGVAPQQGEHTREILDAHGYSNIQVELLLKSGVVQ